jgi:hypothetical protein
MPKKDKSIKSDEYKWMTPICTLKFDNSRYPCECQPFWDNWSNPISPVPDCSKCQIAIDYGMVPEVNPEEELGVKVKR